MQAAFRTSVAPASRPGRQAFTVEAKALTRKASVQKRHLRVRQKVTGTTERPRLAVYRSNEHIYAQVIDDSVGHTLASANTMMKEIKDACEKATATTDAAKLVGKKIAELCSAKNIGKVSFDRGGNIYTGRVAAVAEAAREGGLIF
mmetsp:Transcript_8678/g.14984  ORF Transcript_8678/g.14984 Transcript_8678/m.14984 type:complete len:146 (+) Transcript_8678:43-480(+)